MLDTRPRAAKRMSIYLAVSSMQSLKLQEILRQEEDKSLKFRVFVAHAHGDHAHYGLGLDEQKEMDELVETEAGVEILLERGLDFLDGIEVDYDTSNDRWGIVNPSKGSHGGH